MFLFVLAGFEGICKLFFHLISFGGVSGCFSHAGKMHRDIGFTFTKCDLTVNELYVSVTIDHRRVLRFFGINRLLFLSFSSDRASGVLPVLFLTKVSCIFCFTSLYLFQMLHVITLMFVLTFHYVFALFWLRLIDLARTKEAC